MDTALIKEIQIQKKFATATYKNFVALRYGMIPCCVVDAEAAALEKELCDWQSKLKCETSCVGVTVNENVGYLTSTPYVDQPKVSQTSSASCPSVTYCPDNSVLENILTSIKEIQTELNKKIVDGFVFTQETVSTEWIIPHNLDKYPNIRMEMPDGTDINGQVTNIDVNSMKVNFDVPVAGTAYLS